MGVNIFFVVLVLFGHEIKGHYIKCMFYYFNSIFNSYYYLINGFVYFN